MRSLRNAIAGVFLAASLLFPIKTFPDKETVFNQTYPIQMTYDYGDKITENLKIKASLDEETNTFYLGIYTQDYNRKNWAGDEKISITIPQRHTSINQSNSRIFILHPVKISELEQKAYIVPQYKWVSELEPYETRETSQLMVETLEKTRSKIFSKIPFLNKLYDKFVKHTEEKESEYYNKIFDKINPDYTRSKISPYIPKNPIGYTETAREYTIKFDIGDTQDEIPMFVWLKIALGDPSQSSYGSFPNRYGELENILIKFNLNENNVKREELYSYFFHESELRYLNIAKKNIEGTKSNPAIITIKNLDWEEREPYEEDKVLRIGTAEYILKQSKYSTEKGLTLKIVQFISQKDREEFMKKREKIKYPSFFKETILSYMEEPTIKDVLNPLKRFDEEQLSFYFDLILDYMNRTGMQIILSENEKENKGVLEAIKEFKEKDTAKKPTGDINLLWEEGR